MVDPNLKPLCDQLHGEMKRVDILVDAGDRLPAFQCQNEICGRVFTELNGYRTWVQGKGGGKPSKTDPRCRTHGHWMYVSAVLSEFILRYKCPEHGCVESSDVKVDIGAGGFWTRVAAHEE